MGHRYDLSFCACTTACLASELQISMGSTLQLWFLHAKQRLLDQNYKSLCILDLTCRFVHANSVISTSLYGFQPSSVVLCIQNSDLRTKIACVYGSHTSPVIFHAKQRILDANNKSLRVPDITSRFVHAIRRD